MTGGIWPASDVRMPIPAPCAGDGATLGASEGDGAREGGPNAPRASERVTYDRVPEIRARLKAATPGPWRWFGDMSNGGSPYLAARHSGRRFVMKFWRNGMQGAQPVFQGPDGMVPTKDLAIYEVCPDATDAKDPRLYRHDIVGFRSPDADLIAHAPEDIRYLLELVERLGGSA